MQKELNDSDKEESSNITKEKLSTAKKSGLKGLAIAFSYGVTSMGMAFANKAILSYYDYDYPLFIISSQMLFTIFMLEALRAARVIQLERFSVSAGREFFLPSLLYAVNSVMSLSALSGMNIPVYGVIKRCTPIIILLLSKLVLNTGWPSTRIMASVGMVTGGCFLASKLKLRLPRRTYLHRLFGFLGLERGPH